MGSYSFSDPSICITKIVGRQRGVLAAAIAVLATFAAVLVTAISSAHSVYTASSRINSSSSRTTSSGSGSSKSSAHSSKSSARSSMNAEFSIDSVKSSIYGQNVAALMEVVNSSWASAQAVTAAKFWLLANRDNLLVCAEPLRQLLRPLQRPALHTSFLDQAAFWLAVLAGLVMGGIAALGRAVVNKLVQ